MHNRIKALDGIRGLAILLVLLAHEIGVDSGWIGVEIFFCLSGFLITSILLGDRQQIHYWKIFYVRRATRILPPYIACLLISALLFPIPWKHVWFYYALSIQNLLNYSPYYAAIAPISILWSLAVEEQFYLVWPLVVRKLSTQAIVIVLSAVIVLDPIARWVGSPFDSVWHLYYCSPLRLDGLALGSLTAVLLTKRGWAFKRANVGLWTIFVSGAVLLFGVVHLHWSRASNKPSSNAFLFLMLAMFSIGIIITVVTFPDGFLSRVFSLRPLTFFGEISYGLYLYHQPLLFALRRFAAWLGYTHMGRIGIPGMILAVGVSWISFNFFERPIIRFGRARAESFRESETVVQV